jgi:hypothetical protein
MKKLLFILLLIPSLVYGAQVSFEWDANPVTEEIAGYKIYYGIASRNYTKNIDVGNVTTGIVKDLPVSTNYFFAATAYDKYGNESDYSNEVQWYATRLTLPSFRIKLMVKPGATATVTVGQ